jgi:molybdopterin synthase sulfur carrier subunit
MTIRFYASLREIVGRKRVEITSSNEVVVEDLMLELAGRWPKLGEHLIDPEGGLPRRVNILVEGRNIRWLKGLATPLRAHQGVDIFPPAAGG